MQRILVGYDGSECARRALDQAARVAAKFGGSLTVLTAAVGRLVRADGVETMAVDEDLGERVAGEGAAHARECGALNVETRTSVDASADAILDEAKAGEYDLIVVGHRSMGPLEELFLGSTAKRVVDGAHCSVLVVR